MCKNGKHSLYMHQIIFQIKQKIQKNDSAKRQRETDWKTRHNAKMVVNYYIIKINKIILILPLLWQPFLATENGLTVAVKCGKHQQPEKNPSGKRNGDKWGFFAGHILSSQCSSQEHMMHTILSCVTEGKLACLYYSPTPVWGYQQSILAGVENC